MKDSNYSLRFHRTAREAFGHSLEFESPGSRGDRWVGYIAIFIAGLLIGGWLL
jgi:hypothetical protein